jgi:anti-sigma28 factor (negative regulator of flagellin synthesis)
MKINGTPTPDVLAATTKNVRAAAAAGAVDPSKAPKTDAAPAAPRDSVEISAAARELAGTESLPTDRIADVRQRILTGAYNANEVVDTVARRILQRGDI